TAFLPTRGGTAMNRKAPKKAPITARIVHGCCTKPFHTSIRNCVTSCTSRSVARGAYQVMAGAGKALLPRRFQMTFSWKQASRKSTSKYLIYLVSPQVVQEALHLNGLVCPAGVKASFVHK